ncbi:hypothetical protein KIL84_015573, partial [Mauremys mutica]
GISPLWAIPLQCCASARSRGYKDVPSLREGKSKRETIQAAGIALSADKGPHEGSSSYLSLPNVKGQVLGKQAGKDSCERVTPAENSLMTQPAQRAGLGC